MGSIDQGLIDGPEFPRAMAELGRVLRKGGELSFAHFASVLRNEGFHRLCRAEWRENGLRVAAHFLEESWIDRWLFSAARRGSEQSVTPGYGRRPS